MYNVKQGVMSIKDRIFAVKEYFNNDTYAIRQFISDLESIQKHYNFVSITELDKLQNNKRKIKIMIYPLPSKEIFQVKNPSRVKVKSTSDSVTNPPSFDFVNPFHGHYGDYIVLTKDKQTKDKQEEDINNKIIDKDITTKDKEEEDINNKIIDKDITVSSISSTPPPVKIDIEVTIPDYGIIVKSDNFSLKNNENGVNEYGVSNDYLYFNTRINPSNRVTMESRFDFRSINCLIYDDKHYFLGRSPYIGQHEPVTHIKTQYWTQYWTQYCDKVNAIIPQKLGLLVPEFDENQKITRLKFYFILIPKSISLSTINQWRNGGRRKSRRNNRRIRKSRKLRR